MIIELIVGGNFSYDDIMSLTGFSSSAISQIMAKYHPVKQGVTIQIKSKI